VNQLDRRNGRLLGELTIEAAAECIEAFEAGGREFIEAELRRGRSFASAGCLYSPALDDGSPDRAAVNPCKPYPVPAVTSGRTESGLRWARSGKYRILAYAEGGWCEQWLNGSVGWCLFTANDAMPWGVRNRLLRVLGLKGGA
jgi:hypothetical protein